MTDHIKTQPLTAISLFSGIGGIDMAAELDGRGNEAWGGGTEPGIRTVDDGVPGKLARQRHIKGYGNAVVPLQVYPILRIIADLLRNQPL